MLENKKVELFQLFQLCQLFQNLTLPKTNHAQLIILIGNSSNLPLRSNSHELSTSPCYFFLCIAYIFYSHLSYQVLLLIVEDLAKSCLLTAAMELSSSSFIPRSRSCIDHYPLLVNSIRLATMVISGTLILGSIAAVVLKVTIVKLFYFVVLG